LLQAFLDVGDGFVHPPQVRTNLPQRQSHRWRIAPQFYRPLQALQGTTQFPLLLKEQPQRYPTGGIIGEIVDCLAHHRDGFLNSSLLLQQLGNGVEDGRNFSPVMQSHQQVEAGKFLIVQGVIEAG